MRQNHIWGLVRALVLGASLILSTAAPGVTNISQARPSGAGNRPDDSRAASLATVQPAADASFATVFGRSPQTPVTAGQLAAYIPPDHVAHGLPRTLAGAVTGPQKVLVLRVYFADYPNTSRYSKSEVESFFGELNQLWQHNSYGQISITYEVSSLFQMPDNRSAYIDDGGTPGTCAETSQGDLSCGGKYLKILTDAVNNAPDGLDWTDLDDVMVVMAETDPSQFHRGQSLCPCVLPAGPGSDDDMNVDGAIFSENPSESDVQVWGRWAHEIGHAFQQDGPPHPSNYNSEFELMDANYPGQTGVFEKQDDQAYPGWLPPAKYETVTPSCDVGPDPCTGLGGGTIPIWAEEYDPSAKPNIQAVKAYITDNLYYLISVRRRVNGDELNGDFVGGIPDEGVLIERVEEQADQWVTVQGPGGDRNKLWHAGNLYTSADDGIFIQVVSKVDDDNYVVSVSYDQDAANQPDVMLYPWVAPPANTWETTDIWIDSPANGYNTYRYGTWNDLSGNPVPVGNGDEPTIGQVNRLYARVRNVGGAPATNVVVHFEITDPPGLGINDQTSWVSLGTVTAAEFPALSNIDPGEFVDVFLNWTPDYDIPDDQVEDGSFAFHTCLRVRLDPVPGETVLGNQDGDAEQENVFYFSVPDGAGDVAYNAIIHLHNDDPFDSHHYYLHYQSDLPVDWGLDINHGQMDVELAPHDVADIPVSIVSGATTTTSVGSTFGVDVYASQLHLLTSDLDPTDQHPENQDLGGVRVETRVVQPTTLDCHFAPAHNGAIVVQCHLGGIDPYYDRAHPPKIMLEAIARQPNGRPSYLTPTLTLLTVNQQGNGSGTLNLGQAGDRAKGAQAAGQPTEIFALFSGTQYLASATTGFYPIGGYKLYLPSVAR